MNKKRWPSLLLATSLMSCFLTSCHGGGEKPVKPTPTPFYGYEVDLSFDTQAYQSVQRTEPNFGEEDKTVSLSCKNSVQSGQGLSFSLSNRGLEGGGYLYYLVDFGDGEQAICGPVADKVSGKVTHIYYVPGEYNVRVKAISLAGSTSTGWSRAKTVTVEGESQSLSYIVPKEAIGSSGNIEALIDGDVSSQWQNDASDETVWAGLKLIKNCRLDTLIIDTAQDSGFPSDFKIEYSTDSGSTWYPVPIYDYNKAALRMKFPHPQGSRLVFNMGGLAANAVRIVANDFSYMDSDHVFAIREMRVLGDDRFLFATSSDDTYNADLNNLWTVFGSAAVEPTTAGSNWLPSDNPFKGGVTGYGVTEWQEWTGLKLDWYNDEDELKEHRSSLLGTRVDEDGRGNTGYVWPSAGDPKHLGVHRKYSTNPTFILAVRNYLVSTNDNEEFLNKKDSRGMTMNQKLDLAMEYMLEVEEGKNGLLVITDPEHDGTASSGPSNYWDNVTCFGYKSAYENALFYGSLLAMADIYTMRGDITNAEYMRTLAATVKENYNELFWDEAKGRYIGSVDINGDRHDYGFTYVNFMAIVYGVADQDRAVKIFEWLDGSRIVEGDTSTGSDIYAFGYAPRSTTIAVESKGEPYCWFDWDKAIWPGPGGAAGFGDHLENGGTIFYVSYFDLMSRLSTLGADSAGQRLDKIMEEFHKDTLRRNTVNEQGADWVEGILGPFPESGLVPSFFVRGMMGINAEVNGLRIAPELPSDWSFAAVNEVLFRGKVYRVETNRDFQQAEVVNEGDQVIVRVPVGQSVLLKADGTLA